MIVRRTEAGASWSDLAQGDPLAAVLDPGDTTGAKNRLIDRVHKRALGRAARDVRAKAVLDFGCGTGRLSEWLVRHGARVTGVDATPEMVEVARIRVPEARFYAIENATVPLPADTFDLVVTAYVLQYYVHDGRAVLLELARVLRPGGRIVAIEQVADTEIGRGGTIEEYGRMFEEGGLRLLETRAIRVRDARVIALVQRHPGLWRLPALPRLIEWEAHRRRNQQLTGGRYADWVFVATKER
jgi:SAM-dependent methyltransferase